MSNKQILLKCINHFKNNLNIFRNNSIKNLNLIKIDNKQQYKNNNKQNNKNSDYNNSNNSSNNNKNNKNNNNNNNNLFLISSILIFKINNELFEKKEIYNKFGLATTVSNQINTNNKYSINNQSEEIKLLDPFEAINEIIGKKEGDEDVEINLLKIGFRVFELGIILLPALITMPLAFIPHANEMWWELLLETIQFSGTCWIKFGQWISTRPDLFPQLLIEKFSQLHSHCPQHSYEFTKQSIESNFGENIDQLFLYFDPIPMASGSVAQVHKAITLDGKIAVVKVLHPNVESNIKRDFFIIYSVIWAFSHIPDMKWLSLPESILEFGKSMMKQSDLELEASHLKKFNENFRFNSEVVFPKPLYPLVSKGVLVESFEPGSPIMDFIKKNDQHNPTLAKIGLSAYMQMMLVDNFIHADLHPGNVLVRTTNNDDHVCSSGYISNKQQVERVITERNNQIHGEMGGLSIYNKNFKENEISKPKLIFLDVGLVTQLGPVDKDHFLELFTNIVNGNGKDGAELLIRYAREAKCTEEEMFQFKEKMGTLFNQVQNSKLSDVHVGQFLSELLGLVREYHVKIESNFATLVMGTIVLEGLGKQLDPSLGLLKAAIPFLLKSSVFSFSDFIKKFFINFDKSNDENNKK